MENETTETTMEGTETVVETTEATEISSETSETSPVSDSIATEPFATEVQEITLDVVYEIRDDFVHADLFGSFLICGAIVAAVLFGRWHR